MTAAKTPKPMDKFSAQHTSTPFAAFDANDSRAYSTEAAMRRDRRNQGARLMVVDRASGRWSDI